jgi:acetoin utilization protein AcuB
MKLKNLTVEEFTSVDPVCVASTIKLDILRDIMDKNNFRHIPVTNNDQCVGIISERDLYRCDRSEISSLTAKDIMKTDVFMVKSSDLIKDVVFEMSKRKIGSAIVVNPNEEMYGIFTSTDALNTIIEMD